LIHEKNENRFFSACVDEDAYSMHDQVKEIHFNLQIYHEVMHEEPSLSSGHSFVGEHVSAADNWQNEH
jgi:hypothetical protein